VINNLYNKLVTADNNGDQRQVYYIWGRITYYLLDIEPIEEAARELKRKQKGSLTEIAALIGKLVEIQTKINSGEIQLPDQTENYWRDKRAYERELKLRKKRRGRRINVKTQSPSFEYQMIAYGELYRGSNEYNKRHLLVGEHDKEKDRDFMGKVLFYGEFAFEFAFHFNNASVGRISKHLNTC